MKQIIVFLVAGALGVASAGAQAKVDFAKQIAPILEQSCVKCHGPEKQKGKLRIDTKAAALKGGSEGPLFVAGDAAKSELIRRILLPKDHDEFMPSEGEPLPKAQIDLLKQWVAEGAVWPDGVALKGAAAAPGDAFKLPDVKASANELKVIEQFAKQIRPLSQKDTLREVNLRLIGDKCTDAFIAPLKEVKTLTQLNLANTKITDAGLASIAGLTNLTVLNLSGNGITDAGLAHLKGLVNLTHLNLFGTKITDKGLEGLKGLKRLQKVYVWQTQATDAGVEKLKQAVPGVYVDTGWKLPPPEPPKEAEKKDAKTEEKK
jgi:mono/diheme cytochrome c family protein